jgi:pyruvate dehydrogenase E2 component (dihydrolipoamide acetyltransferase)
MATKVFMEALSPTMEEGRLVKWLKNEGDEVKSGDPLAEVETDKAIMELVARGDGLFRKRLVGEGESRPVGTLVGVIAAADENIDALVAEAGSGPASGAGAAPAAATPAPAPPAASTPAPATTGGGRAKPPAKVVAQAQENAGASPVPRTGQEAQGEASTPPQEKAGAREAGGGVGGPPPAVPASPPARAVAAADAGGTGGNGGRVRSSPLARRLASERGLDLGQVQGTGPGGRIIKRDIEEAAAQGAEARPAAAAAAGAPPRPAGVPSGGVGDFEDVPLTQIRKTIARRLSESIGPVPTFYLTAEFDLSRMAEARAAMAAMGDDFKASFNDIILKAVATAVRQHREVNAHWMGDRIRYHNRVHLGMAVATDDGLIVPVIFDADHKSLREIAGEARELAKRARERKLTPDQYTGGTFSVSNLGMFGIDQFTAIINPPEAGILAIGAIEDKPVVVDGAVTTRQRLRVTMSCDHRVIDGAIGARFLQTLRRMLENPLMLVF